jgi:hypothetical protein
MKYIFVLFLLLSCSSIEFISGGTFSKDPPNIPFQTKQDLEKDEKDCRRNKDHDSKVLFFLKSIKFPEELTSEWIRYFQNYTLKIYNSNESNLILETIDTQFEYNSLCNEKEIDIIIESEVKNSKDIVTINQIFKDSYNNFIYGNIIFQIKKEVSQGNDKIREFFYSKGTLYNINKYDNNSLEFHIKPDLDIIKKIINKNKLAFISVFSSDLDVDVYVDSERIGSIPIQNKPIKSGRRIITFRKKNSLVTREREIFARPGKYLNILDPFINSYNPTSLYLYSEPRDLPVYRESIKIGSTPLLINNVSPGETYISINSIESNEIILKPGITNILVRPENAINAFDDTTIWDLKNIGNLKPDFTNGLGFINDSGEYISEWSGLHTHILNKGKIEIIADLYPAEEFKETEVIIGVFDGNAGPSVSLEGDNFSVYDFRKNNRDLKSYKIINPESNLKKIKFLINYNNIKIYFNNEKIFDSEISLKNEWRFFISCKGAIYNRVNVLKNLSFKYL